MVGENQKWTIEAGPITSSILGEYMTVEYSVNLGDGTMRIVQRVTNNKNGYAIAYRRVSRIAAAPELYAILADAPSVQSAGGDMNKWLCEHQAWEIRAAEVLKKATEGE
jgi:hypothetical protein